MLINALNHYTNHGKTEHGPAVVEAYRSNRGVVIVRVRDNWDKVMLAHTYLSSENARALAQELVEAADKAGPSKTKAERIREVLNGSHSDAGRINLIRAILDEVGDL